LAEIADEETKYAEDRLKFEMTIEKSKKQIIKV
jgi:hypothetical protein